MALDLAARRAGGAELRDDLPAVGDENAVTGSYVSHVLTQSVLQLSQAHGLHASNVAA